MGTKQFLPGAWVEKCIKKATAVYRRYVRDRWQYDMRAIGFVLCLWVLMLASLVCTQTDTSKELEPVACAEAREKDSQIQKLIQDKSCTNVSQCKAIAYGYKACGGPESYLIYSAQSADQSVVTHKVTEYNGLRETCVRAQKMGSDCSTPFEPTLSCLLSLCAGTTP